MNRYLILNEVIIRKIPNAMKIEARTRIIISLNNKTRKPIKINTIPIFRRRFELCDFML